MTDAIRFGETRVYQPISLKLPHCYYGPRGYERIENTVCDYHRMTVEQLAREVIRLEQVELALDRSPHQIDPCKDCGEPVVHRSAVEPLCIPCDWARGRDANEVEKEPNVQNP